MSTFRSSAAVLVSAGLVMAGAAGTAGATGQQPTVVELPTPGERSVPGQPSESVESPVADELSAASQPPINGQLSAAGEWPTGGREHAAPWDPPAFSDASVHDPSLIVVDGEFWVFGSHLASARSPDLMSWEQVSDGVSADNPLFEDVHTELAEAFEWANTDTLWAADVVQLDDGRFYMYYNACQGDAPRSALGVAVADSVDGPYSDLGIILRSGMWDEPSEDGTIYDPQVHPNTIDPDVFFDAEGTLWMVYGSYSGGIFILELDPATGLPLPDQGYGTHLIGGNHARIEGPTMAYDPETGYYYLHLTFGGLDADGGYNMRVVRSENPDGPFFDAEGNDMREVRSDPDLPLFDDASIEPYGVKLMGNHLTPWRPGDPGEPPGVGYVSPGHNTTYRDPETGDWYLIFHSRFPGRGEQHEIRVHQMWMNSDGWPVVAPHRYGDGPPDRILPPLIPGDYAAVDHGKEISAEIRTAETVTLTRSGDVTGAMQGRWWRNGPHQVRMQIDDVDYVGRFSWQWEPQSQAWTPAFTVQSEHGRSLWGTQVEPMPSVDVVDAVAGDLDLPAEPVISDLDLPISGTRDAVIGWESSAPDVLSTDGTVRRPQVGQEDVDVTLTATVSHGDATREADFEIVVAALTVGGLEASYTFDGTLAAEEGGVPDATPTGARIDDPGTRVEFTDGVTGQALLLGSQTGVRLPDGLLAGREYSVALWLRPERLTPYTTAFFAARDAEHWVSLVPMGHPGVDGETMVWTGSYDAPTGMQIPIGSWTHLALTVDEGDLTVYVDGEARHTGSDFPDVLTTTTGAFAVGVNYWDEPFEGAVDDLRLYSVVLTAAEVAELATP